MVLERRQRMRKAHMVHKQQAKTNTAVAKPAVQRSWFQTTTSEHEPSGQLSSSASRLAGRRAQTPMLPDFADVRVRQSVQPKVVMVPPHLLPHNAKPPSRASINRIPTSMIMRSAEPELERFKGDDVNKVGKVSAPEGQYEVAKTSGVRVYAKPDGNLGHIARIRYDTLVQVQALDNTGAFIL